LSLRGHDLRFCRHVRLHDLLKGLHGLFGIERVAGELEAEDLATIGLTC
jgi:hypothetical protein